VNSKWLSRYSAKKKRFASAASSLPAAGDHHHVATGAEAAALGMVDDHGLDAFVVVSSREARR